MNNINYIGVVSAIRTARRDLYNLTLGCHDPEQGPIVLSAYRMIQGVKAGFLFNLSSDVLQVCLLKLFKH